MQNEPNFKNAQMDTTDEITRSYENTSAWTLGKNEPKTNPIYALGNKPNFIRHSLGEGRFNPVLTKMSHREKLYS